MNILPLSQLVRVPMLQLIENGYDPGADICRYVALLSEHHQVGPVHQQVRQEYAPVRLPAGEVVVYVLSALSQTLISKHNVLRLYNWRSHSHTRG